MAGGYPYGVGSGSGYPPYAAPPPPPNPYSTTTTSSSSYPPSAPPYGHNQGGYGYGPGCAHQCPPPPHGGYGCLQSPFAVLAPSAFPPGTDPNVVACFQAADGDGSGLIDDRELQRALSSSGQRFSIRTVRLMMYLFTSSNSYRIGPKEFSSVFCSLQNWRAMFERFDQDRSGKVDTTELRDALLSLGFSLSPGVLDLLVSKFDKSGGLARAIEYDHFIECCLTVKGLTEKFKEKDMTYSGSATFTYDSFMLTVLPFLIA